MRVCKERRCEYSESHLRSNLGSNHLARTAPGRVPVDKHNRVLGQSLLEVGGATGGEEKKICTSAVVQFPCPSPERAQIGLRGWPAGWLAVSDLVCKHKQNSLFDVVDSHLGQRRMERSRKSKSGSDRER